MKALVAKLARVSGGCKVSLHESWRSWMHRPWSVKSEKRTECVWPIAGLSLADEVQSALQGEKFQQLRDRGELVDLNDACI
jgi:hypothetical protein